MMIGAALFRLGPAGVRIPRLLPALVLFAAAAQAPLAAQDGGAPAQPVGDTLAGTSLRASFRQVVSNLRSRVVNTVSTVTWPVLPQEPEVPPGPGARVRSALMRRGRTLVIPNGAFITSNAGPKQDLPRDNGNAAEIYASLDLGKDERTYLQDLLAHRVEAFEAGETALDRRRVEHMLKFYSGAELIVDVNGKERARPDLVWEFTEIKRHAPDGHPYYRYEVNVRAPEVNVSLDPADGAQQQLRITMTLRPDPDLPPIRDDENPSVECTQDVEKSEETAEQAGAGEANPLLLLMGLASPAALAQQLSGPLLSTGKISAITGILASRKGSDPLAGVNVSLTDRPSQFGQFGVAAGVATGSRLYAGPSISLGDGVLVLSVGPLFGKESGDSTRLAGTASLDLSRLLFGKPRADRGRQIVIPAQDVKGLYTSRRILSMTGVLVIEGPPGTEGYIRGVSPQPYGPIGPGGRDARFVEHGVYDISVDPPGGVGRIVLSGIDVVAGKLRSVRLPGPGGGGGGGGGASPPAAGTIPPPPGAAAPGGAAPAPAAGPAPLLRMQFYVEDPAAGIRFVPGALVQLDPVSGDDVVPQAQSGPDGFASLSPKPGRYNVRSAAAGYKAYRGTIEIIANQPKVVIVKFERAP